MAKRAHFIDLKKNPKYMPSVVWDEDSKTDLGYETGPSQQKCQRKPSLHSMATPAVRVITIQLGWPVIALRAYAITFSVAV